MNNLRNDLYANIQMDISAFDFIQNVALDGFWYVDTASLEHPFINTRFWNTLGYSGDSVLPAWQDVLETENKTPFRDLLNQWAVDPDIDHRELLHMVCCRHQTGKRLWLQCRAQVLPVSDGQPRRLLLAYIDITELKAREVLLNRCNTEAKIGYWELNIQDNQLFWSEVTRRIHEVPVNYQPTLSAALDFYDPVHRPLITDKVQRAIDYGESYANDLLLVTLSGQKKWVRAIGVSEMLDGVCQRVYGTFQDIDEAKRNQLAREESERKFKGIFDSTFSFIWLLNCDGILLDANQTGLEMAGLSSEDVTGKPFWDCYWWQISASTQSQLRANIVLAAQGQESTYEVDVWIADQTPITILFSLRPVFDVEGQVAFIVPEGRPIQDIVDTRRRYKSVLDATQVGTWEWSIPTGAVTVNDRWTEMVGYALEELMPVKLDTWKKIIHPEDLFLANEKLQACFTQQSEYYEIDFRMRHKQGYWIWIQATGKVLSWTAEGAPLMMYGTHQEITARKKDEEEIHRLYNLTQDQNERLKGFSQIVSHNLRSHAGGIQGLLEVLKLNHPELKDNELLKMLNKASQNLSETISDLSDTVVSGFAISEDKQSLPLFEIVRKNIESVASLAEQAQVQLINKVPENARVQAIPAYLNSLVLNFITNAIKYCAPQRESFLEISLESERGTDRIAFKDNGLGIDLEKHGKKLFEMYQTFHKHADSRGIGLYITHNQVKLMGGCIEVSSKQNEGTTFWVCLPQ